METPVGSVRPGRGQAEGSKATQFAPGHAGRKRGAGRKRRQPSRLLCDMRKIYEQDESKDRTPGLKALRKLLQENPREFIAQLGTLEKAHRAATSKRVESRQSEALKPTAEAVVDEGTERCLAIATKLLADLDAEQAKEDAELAARPDAAAFAGTLQKRLAEALRREAVLKEKVEVLQGKRQGTLGERTASFGS
jgi:hypothetical protein